MVTKKAVTSKRSQGKLVKADNDSSLKASGVDIHPRVSFIKAVKFVGIGLDRCAASVRRDELAEAKASQKDLEVHINVRQTVMAHETDFFIVGAEFTIVQSVIGSAVELVSIEASFSARFSLSAPAAEEYVTSFANLEARLIFFPYLRHFVSDITYRMSIETILLPMTSELESD